MPYYTLKPLGYINHPPFWKHVTNFSTDKDGGELCMLMRSGTQPTVQVEKIPTNWDGHPTFAPATKSIGTRNLQLDDIAWTPLLARNGSATGLEAKRVAEDRDDGWTTWVMRAHPGWEARGALVEAQGGDEIYVIEGDLTLGREGRPELRKSGYVCNASRISEGKGTLASKKGALFVRWTRGAEGVWQVAPQV